MDLCPGSRLGSYEIVELLGEGGMGMVYRARDPRLERDVAIKIVHAIHADDPECAARFGREARLLASLNHPHIATVHGFDEAGSTRFLVLELVEGVTLAARLREGPLPVREALTLAIQIAAAVEAAHERHIIHRDLKPANIKITPAGTVKVLDFGLAKCLSPGPAAAAIALGPTLTSGGTGEGVILGTAAYMSPEQARGKDVDTRTDIWSFGCVLFDMLTGRRAFPGDTLSDTVAAILTREPDWTALPPDLPMSIRRLLGRCLQKEVNHRLRDIGDARFEIEESLSSSGDSSSAVATPAGPAASRSPLGRWNPASVAAGALVTGAMLGGGLLWLLEPAGRATERPTVQFTLPLPGEDRLADLDFQMLAIAPADTHIVYVAGRRGRFQLFLRALSSIEAQPLAGTEGALNPFFSPDGQWIAFFAAGKLRKISIGGGSVRDIADAEIGFGGAWAADNTIVFAASNASALSRVSADGGTPEPFTTLDTTRGEFSHRWPEVLPDGRTVLFTIGTVGRWDDADIAAQALDGGKRRILMQGGTFPRYATTGHLLYARRGSIYAVPLNLRTYDVTGAGTPVMDNVLESVDGAAQFAISRAGSIAYIPGGGSAGRTLVWVDHDGNAQPLAAAAAAYRAPRLSPDGRTLALGIAGGPEQIWTYSIPDNKFAQLTLDGGSSPVWSADGQRIFFSATRGGPPALFVKAADGSSDEQRLTKGERAHVPFSAAPNDGSLLFGEFDAAAGRDILRLGADGVSRALLATPADESAAAASPDGRWVAYVSDDTGRAEVFVAPMDNPGRRVQVSSQGGAEPVWRRDGGELFFRSGRRMMAATVRTAPSLAAAPPRQLFEAEFETGSAGSPAYDVSKDGMRFLMLRPAAADSERRELRVVLGWSAELKR